MMTTMTSTRPTQRTNSRSHKCSVLIQSLIFTKSCSIYQEVIHACISQKEVAYRVDALMRAQVGVLNILVADGKYENDTFWAEHLREIAVGSTASGP